MSQIPGFADIPALFQNNTGLIEKTLLQIEKDFSSNGLSLQLPLNEVADYKRFCDKMAEVLDWLLSNDRARLMQLLYRIDLPHNRLLQALDADEDLPVHQKLAQLIVLREAQKVIIRSFYQGQT
jgi:TorA maturation chaperone TorD